MSRITHANLVDLAAGLKPLTPECSSYRQLSGLMIVGSGWKPHTTYSGVVPLALSNDLAFSQLFEFGLLHVMAEKKEKIKPFTQWANWSLKKNIHTNFFFVHKTIDRRDCYPVQKWKNALLISS